MSELYVTIDGFSRIDFDRKKIRKAMRSAGRFIQQDARRMVSRRAISHAMEYPGLSSGMLRRSIQVRLSRPGFLVKVGPYNKFGAMKDFYPAFLHYGTKGLGRIQRLAPGEGRGVSNRRRRGDRQKLIEERNAVDKYVISPRKNYMEDALNNRRAQAQAAILNALQDALIPRK